MLPIGNKFVATSAASIGDARKSDSISIVPGNNLRMERRLVFRLRHKQLCILKNIQSAAFKCQQVEPFIFQSKFEKNVTCARPKEQEKKANARGNHADGQIHWHKIESENYRAESCNQGARPFEQEQPEQGVSHLVNEQNQQSFPHAD
jgi:hypothetical protein